LERYKLYIGEIMKKYWEWIKKNWKLLLGASIPIIIGVLVRGRNAREIWQEVSESKDKEMQLKDDVNAIGNNLRDQAWKDLHEDKSNLNEFEKRRRAQIEAERLARLEELDSADKATQAIKDKLEE